MTWNRCCEPRVAADMNLRHEKGCPLYPQRKLTIVEESDLRDWRIRRNAERLPTVEEIAMLDAALAAPARLRLVDQDYIDAHLDDDDDVERTEP